MVDTSGVSLPSNASRSIDIAASPEEVYDLVSDVTRTGEWSPECRSCEWVDEPGRVGSKFKGHNKSGPARWTTTAEVLAADRPTTFGFATLFKDGHATRWTYEMAANGEGTTLTESFESVDAPAFIKLAERFFIRNRQEQLEKGIDETLAKIKALAERPA
jgi:Polyketide cyclase / dehydrase and lipid transport